MTELTAKRDEVKRQIRSLLESAPLGLTLGELKRDFKIFIGTHLPTRNLGYSNDEEFLNDISDVVKVTWKGNTMVLTAVSGQETQHLVKMINRQKIDCKKNWGVLKCARVDRNPLFSKPPAVSNNFFTRNPGSDSLNWRSPPYVNNTSMSATGRPPYTAKVVHRSPPCVPAFIRGQIFNLIKNKPEGLPLIYFKSVYRKNFGVSLDPQSLGFADEEALLSNLPDIVQLKKFGSEIRVMLAAVSDNGSNKVQHTQDVDSEKSKTSSNKQKFGSCGDSLTFKDIDEACVEETNCNIPPVFQNYVRQIISKYPSGISSSRLPSEFKAAYKSDLPVKTYGYNSVIEFVSDLPHIIHIERPQPQGDWILYPAKLKPVKKDVGSECKDSCEESDLSTIVVDQGTKDTIIQVLAMQKDGIALDKFQDIYKEMTGKALDVKEYNARSVKQLLLSLSDIVLISICPKDKYRLHLRDSISVRKFDKLSSNYQPLLVPENKQADDVLQLPVDVVGPGCFFKPQPIPKIDDEHRYINLYVSFVITPSLFWIQLRGNETTVALEDLMDDLEKVYDSKKLSKDYMMTAKTAKVGMVCAAIFPEDNFWYRAIIKDIKDPYYEVLYIDYGNTCSVTLCQLRLLKAKFLKLPGQAIQARLSHCQPVGETWDVRARDRLLSLSKDKPLFGLVTDIKDRVISVCLIDTSEENKDIHINDVLCHEGYGRFVADNQPPSVSTPSPKLLKNFLSHLIGVVMTYCRWCLYIDNQGILDILLILSSELLYGAVNPEKSQRKNCVYVRQVQMTDSIIMNLINLESHPYLLSFEISSLFFKEDIIGSKLKRDNVEVKKIIVNKANYPELFEELLLYDVANFNEQSDMLSLFSLSGFPLILKLYGKGKEFEEMKETAQELINWFDPEDKYWKGEDEMDSESCSTQDDLESLSTAGERPSMDELKMALQTLNIQRKRILHNMMTTGNCRPDSVNELHDVETKIKKVEDYMKRIELDITVASSASGHYMAISPQDLSAASQNKSTQKVAPIIHSSLEAETLLQNSMASSGMGQINALLMEQQNRNRNTEALLQGSLASSGMGRINTVLLEQQNTNRTQSTLFPPGQQTTMAASSVNPSLVNQQLLALLQQQMLQTQYQQQSAALGMQSFRSSVSPSSLLTSLTPAGSSLNFLPNEQLVQNTLLVQNQRLQQQQLNAFNAALASLSLGSTQSSNLSDLLNVPSSNIQLGIGSAVYHGAVSQNSATAASVGLTPAQQSQLRQLQQLQNLAVRSSVTTSR